jgi:hypothetical protein
MHSEALAILAAAGYETGNVLLTPLPGGVSSEIHIAQIGSERVVVKSALEKLRVASDWHSDPIRILAEGDALRWFHCVTPHYVPDPIAITDSPPGLVIPYAPEPSVDWRTSLLSRITKSDVEITRQLRQILTQWHSTSAKALSGTRLDDTNRLRTLRLEPFYQDMATSLPEFNSVISDCITELLEQRTCMVHGDFSPKNVLLFEGGIWVLDAEVAHIGNPVLDYATMSAHLILKALFYRDSPESSEIAQSMIEVFLDTESVDKLPATLSPHTGVFLGVRAIGRSPAQYLSSHQQLLALNIAKTLLAGATIQEAVDTWLT